MLRKTPRPDPAVLHVAFIAGFVALIVGAGLWAFVVAAVALGAGVVTVQIWALAETLRHMDASEHGLNRRARSAVRTAQRLNRSAPAGPIAERFRAAETQLETCAANIEMLIRRASAVRQLRNGINPAAADPVDAVISELRARAESQLAALESVVARQIEVLALADVDPSGHAMAALERLGVEVDALRAGLDEAQRLGDQLPTQNLLEEMK